MRLMSPAQRDREIQRLILNAERAFTEAEIQARREASGQRRAEALPHLSSGFFERPQPQSRHAFTLRWVK
ncbi:hypothetical protein ABIE13_003397 [Ottowia thiooxydans]|uniref:Uncharacterized protein n=1 Tax=Ottowia thiooxydans TaxID=219182 RepID=A0ABV2QB70_9BURK